MYWVCIRLSWTEGENFSNVITCVSYVKRFFVDVIVNFVNLIKSSIQQIAGLECVKHLF